MQPKRSITEDLLSCIDIFKIISSSSPNAPEPLEKFFLQEQIRRLPIIWEMLIVVCKGDPKITLIIIASQKPLQRVSAGNHVKPCLCCRGDPLSGSTLPGLILHPRHRIRNACNKPSGNYLLNPLQSRSSSLPGRDPAIQSRQRSETMRSRTSLSTTRPMLHWPQRESRSRW